MSLATQSRRAINNIERQLIVYNNIRKYLTGNVHRYSTKFTESLEAMLPFEDALVELINKIGPIRLHTLRFPVSRPVEELVDTLRHLKIMTESSESLFYSPTHYYASREDAEALHFCRFLKIGK